MLFTSWIYILFLAITVTLYWVLPHRFRIPLLLIASYVFYMSWSPPFGLIYGPLIFLDSVYFYWLSRAMLRWPEFKKRILVVGVVSELCLLGYFKYSNFLLGSLDGLLAFFNLPPTHGHVDVFLPLAISFTNFILISYLVDVYRGNEKPDSFMRFATYVAFFPHLIAGPIVRASELLHQFDRMPALKLENVTRGLHLFIGGVAIKLFMADQVGSFVDVVHASPQSYGQLATWIAAYAFVVQIFCDFAGYTRMAQGSALLMGYTLPENFNAPLFSTNIVDFWRRWHMSLSRWLRDYLYIPLGGNRQGRFRTSLNLFITMGLGGLWHGASWNFVIWGVLHGAYLSLQKLGDHWNINRWIPALLGWVLTFHAFVLSMVFFRAVTLNDALHMLGTMFAWQSDAFSQGMTNTAWFILVMVGCYFGIHGTIRFFERRGLPMLALQWSQGIAYAVLIYLGWTFTPTTQTFIYFQF